MKISTKIFSTVLTSSLSLLLVASTTFYFSERKNLQQQIYNQLQSIASLQQARLVNIIEQNLERLQLVASRTQLRISFTKYLHDENKDEQQEKMLRILNDAKLSIPSFRNIHLLSLDGTIVASTENPDKTASRQFEKSILERAQVQASADTLTLSRNGELLLLLAGPLYLDKNLLGIIIIETDVANFVASVSNYTGLGQTGEIVVTQKISNGDAVFLFPTRFDPRAGLKRVIAKEKVASPFIKGISQQSNLITKGVDYRGQVVLAASKYLDLVGWTILVKIDEAEAFSAIAQARKLITAVTVILICIAFVIALALSKNITRYIGHLTCVTRKIADDGLLTQIEKISNDEIGELAHSFNEMIKTRQVIEEEREGLVTALQNALMEVKTLQGILPICAICKSIRNDEGYYEQIEEYIHRHSGVDFSHTICPKCMKKHYPQEYALMNKEKE